MARDKLIIIGAGVAGLSAACYARMNGYDVEIFEKHVLPGGMCTSWERKNYTFDYCIHNLSGTAPGSDLHLVWDELGALEDTPIIDRDVFVRVAGGTSETRCGQDHAQRIIQETAGPRKFSYGRSMGIGFTGCQQRGDDGT